MPDINWNILQPAQSIAPIRTAAPQAQGGSAPVGGGGSDDLYKMQEIQLERQKNAQEYEMENKKFGLLSNEDKRAAQLQPYNIEEKQATVGLLGAQTASVQAETQGKLLTNKETQIDLAVKQRNKQYQDLADKSFMDVRNKGGSTEQQMDAYQAALPPEAAQAFMTTRQTYKDSVVKGNYSQLQNAAGMVYASQQDYANAQTPKDKQAVIDNLNKQLDRVDPDHTKITDEASLHAYSIASVGTMLDPKLQYQHNLEIQKIQIEAEAKANASDSSKLIQSAQADASSAQTVAQDAVAADQAATKAQAWMQVHPDAMALMGPGFVYKKGAREKLAAMGAPMDALDQMETFESTTSRQLEDTIKSLGTIPRSDAVINALTKSAINPSDTFGTIHAKKNEAIYASKYATIKADFIGDFKDANGGNTTGALTSFGNFISHDPALLKGNIDPNYLTPQNYQRYLNRNFNPPPLAQPATNNQTQPATNMQPQTQGQMPQQPNQQYTPQQKQAALMELKRRGVI